MLSIGIITSRRFDAQQIFKILNASKNSWTVNISDQNVYIENYDQDVLKDYVKFELDDEVSDGSDYPMDLALADEAVYRKVIGDFNKFDVGFFRSKEKVMLTRILALLVEYEEKLLIDNGYGVIVLFRDLMSERTTEDWVFMEDHKMNLRKT
jgi:hypothetical protein